MSRTVFDARQKREDILKIEHEMASSGFWENREHAARMSQDLAALKREVQKIDLLTSEVKTLGELLQISGEDASIIKEIESRTHALARDARVLENELFFSGPYDKGNATLTVYAGAGGKDAEDWSALLLRMYQRFAEKRGWHVKIIHEHWGENQGPAGWGIKNVTISIEGSYAYGYIKKESGVHRLVRMSPFSAQQLRHTSFALVDVMPEFVAAEEVEINPEDLKIDFFRSSGPGGQNVNKRETAVRITHVPSGIAVASQVERSQESNRETAMGILRAKLWQLRREQQEKERMGLREEKKAIEWGSQIRSYVMHPYQMVKDHRTDMETSQIDKVLDGDLDDFIDAEIHESL
ncbi:MAG: peptide chain release factor 2 [bacterium]|nr:peptide chain release factor 2 [bacterium]